LCIISNHLQLLRLRKSEIPVEVEEALGSIETSVRRIAGSIEALLEYARVQPGERQPTDLNEAMRRILVLLQYHPLCRRLSVVTDLEAALPMVDLDRAAWEQVMLELVTNAREAMAEGGRVRIETRRVAPEGAPTTSQWIQVIVEDDGPGIPPGEMARVFDPFFTTRATKRGMGIGLKICRDIVHEHGGQMRVESGGQAGTRVAILLRAFAAERADGAAGGLRRDQ
jgi:signal transduction histidine kinase